MQKIDQLIKIGQSREKRGLIDLVHILNPYGSIYKNMIRNKFNNYGVFISCKIICSEKLFYQSILKNFEINDIECNDYSLFIYKLKSLNSKKYFLILEDSDYLLSLKNSNQLILLSKLNEFTNKKVCPVFISFAPWIKFVDLLCSISPFSVNLKLYQKEEIINEIAKDDFRVNYSTLLKIVLDFLYPITHDIKIIRRATDYIWESCDLKSNDLSSKQIYLKAKKYLENGKNGLFGFIFQSPPPQIIKNNISKAEMLFIISSYLASFGKSLNNPLKKNIKTPTNLKTFSLDQLIEIFRSFSSYPISDIIISDILNHLQIIGVIKKVVNPNKTNDLKYKCLIGRHIVDSIAKELKISIDKYLK